MNIIFFPDFDLHIILRLLFRDVKSATLSCKARATGAPTQLMSSSRVFRNCCYHFHLFYSRLQEVLPSQFPIFHLFIQEPLQSSSLLFITHPRHTVMRCRMCKGNPFDLPRKDSVHSFSNHLKKCQREFGRMIRCKSQKAGGRRIVDATIA